MSEKIIYVILIIIGLILMIGSSIKILEKDKKQTEQIKELEQSLAEQIQEKQVYINILERSSNGD